MSNEIVKFSNQFNEQALRKFTALDLDVLMAISTKVRDKGTVRVDFTFDELRRLTRLKKNLTNEQLAKEIIQVNDRLLALHFMFRDGRATIQFALFSSFRTDPDSATLSVAVNQEFAFLLNNLTSEFTRFELAEFVDLKSSYSKEFYRRARQYKSTGVWAVSLDDFRRYLDIPASYTTGNINQSVLAPIRRELGTRLGLRIERRYAKKNPSKRGPRSLSGFVFHFHFPEPGRARMARELARKPTIRIDGQTAPGGDEKKRNRAGREWYQNNSLRCKDGVTLPMVCHYANEHTEISLADLPSAFEMEFARG